MGEQGFLNTLGATEPPSYDLTLATSASPPGRLTEVGKGRVWIARWMASTTVRSQTMDSCAQEAKECGWLGRLATHERTR